LSGLYDEDGIDGPFERAMDAAIRDDAKVLRLKREAQPNPGSDEAQEQGCTCPVWDNEHGRGYMGGPDFVINCDCPMHGVSQGDAVGDEPVGDGR
jgi:hypothetical protein